MSLPEHYTIEPQSNGDYAVNHAILGELINDAPFYSTALHFAQDHAADAAEAEAQEAAEYEPSESVQNAVADFLTACDHGLIEISRSVQDSSFFIGLRKAHAAATARAA